MTRDEAIKVIEQNRIYYRDFKQEELDKAVQRLKEPVTLAEFIGWEEGARYRRNGEIYKVEGNHLLWLKNGTHWHNACIETWKLADLRCATKREPKKIAYHVKDEYSYNWLMKELEEQGYVWKRRRTKPTGLRKPMNGDVVIYINDEILTFSDLVLYYSDKADEYNLIEYHKEEPKYYAKIKGWYLLEKDNYYYRWHRELKRITLGTKVRTMANENRLDHYLTKEEWNELGINETNADFEEVEE